MRLSHLLHNIADIESDVEIGGLCLDSRKVRNSDLFVAVNGALQHGIIYAGQAIGNGAAAIIYDPEGFDKNELNDIAIVAVAIKNLSRYLGEIAARFYGRPSTQIDVIGITGTNGKTTCSQLIAQAIPNCGVIGTLGWGTPDRLNDTPNTTPDPLALQEILHRFTTEHKTCVAMEVSSHGLEQGRVNAIDFKGAVFTNLSRDHLDYHGDMDAYLRAKLGLFTNPALDFAVVNLDDENSHRVLAALKDKVKRWAFSSRDRLIDGAECLTTSQIEHSSEGIRFKVTWSDKQALVKTPIVGAFNLENVMSVLCVLLAMGWSFEEAVVRLAHLRPVVGRMEKFGGQGKPTVIVDYAHTPDALEKVLMAVKGSGKLWTVFGCGGDRDKGKRPQMGHIAETHADRVIVTDDNPRTEISENIIADILKGCRSDKISVINDRYTAINTVIQQAKPNDCIVIAGKGHENYQDVNGVRMPFSDQRVVQEALEKRSGA
ncbi:MAG: UDP-N-acetylmuramoyl-L-alanyl-D-glutamate--2,6-diaminopimelate ligase [Gammaproteobacteria bacterium]